MFTVIVATFIFVVGLVLGVIIGMLSQILSAVNSGSISHGGVRYAVIRQSLYSVDNSFKTDIKTMMKRGEFDGEIDRAIQRNASRRKG